MKHLPVIVLVLLMLPVLSALSARVPSPDLRSRVQDPGQQPNRNICISCHIEGAEGTPKLQRSADDVHHIHVRQCVLCHGGNELASDGAAAKDDTFLGAPSPEDVESVCIRCHQHNALDQEGSRHSGLEYPDWGEEWETRRTKRPTCITCHPAHNTHAVDDSMVALEAPGVCGKCHEAGATGSEKIERIQKAFLDYSLFISRMEDLLGAAEGSAATLQSHELLAEARQRIFTARGLMHTWDADRIEGALRGEDAPALPEKFNSCVSCHVEDPHGKAPLALAANEVHANLSPRCVGCHGGNPEGRTRREAKDSSFLAVPSTLEIDQFCARCHSKMLADQADTAHAAAPYHGPGQNVEERWRPHCTVCHPAHRTLTPDESLLALDSKAGCGRCHTVDDPGGTEAKQIRAVLEQFRGNAASTLTEILRASERGMPLERERALVEQAPIELRKARREIHTWSADVLSASLEEGRQKLAEARGRITEIEAEWTSRRLWVIAAGIVFFVFAITLCIYIMRLP